MNAFRSVVMAFCMFSRVPMPRIEWKDENMRYLLCAFPLVGAAVGLSIWLWQLVCAWLGIGQFLWAAGVTLLPVAVTGGIHMDGFCDVSDALASHAPTERKREILKDSHTGAFAIIQLGCWLLLYFAAATELPVSGLSAAMLTLLHIFSRILSGLTSIVFPKNAGEGLLKTFTVSADKKTALTVLLILLPLCAAGMVLLGGIPGAAMIMGGAVTALYLKHMSAKQFGGMSGDLSGWFLQMAELTMLLCFVLIGKVVSL